MKMKSIAKALVLRRILKQYRPTTESRERLYEYQLVHWRQRYPWSADTREDYMLHIDEGYILDAMVEPRAQPAREAYTKRRMPKALEGLANADYSRLERRVLVGTLAGMAAYVDPALGPDQTVIAQGGTVTGRIVNG